VVDLVHKEVPCGWLEGGEWGGMPQIVIFEVKDLRPPHVERLVDLPTVHLPYDHPRLPPPPLAPAHRSHPPPVKRPPPLSPCQRLLSSTTRYFFEGGEGTPEGLLDIPLLDLGVLPPPALLGVHLLMPKVGELLGEQLGLQVPKLEVPPDLLLATRNLPQGGSHYACPLPAIESDQIQCAPVCNQAFGAALHQHGLDAIFLKSVRMILEVPERRLQDLRAESLREGREGQEGARACLVFVVPGVGWVRMGEPVGEGRSQVCGRGH
jgi:hypothetical protein